MNIKRKDMNTTINIKQMTRTIILLLMLPIFFGCQDDARSGDSDQMLLTEEQRQAIDTERKQMLAQIEEKLDAADQRIEKINQLMLEKGTGIAQDADAKYENTLTELTTLRKDLKQKMSEVGEATDENWEQFKTDIGPYITKVDNDLDTLARTIGDLIEIKEEK